jgi:hypothetical protein
MKDAPAFEKWTFAVKEKSVNLDLKQTFAHINMNEAVKCHQMSVNSLSGRLFSK